MLKETLEEIKNKIKISALKSGRSYKDIILVAVTKRVSVNKIKEIISLGINNLGESYLQEAEEKVALFPEANWHFIGHLQKNKVKKIIDLFNLIHSVDSWEILKKINQEAEKKNKKQPVLLEVNIARERSKFGFFKKEVIPLLKSGADFKNISFYGLMAYPPLCQNPNDNRPYFKEIYQLFLEINAYKFYNWEGKYLSMGTSNDFEIAVSEGSNLVRLGRILFGERNK
ncbi:MAG: YggS family pyridoxal phosphate-dependent enzyme [Armatimonadetes bacterium]|nr:YggS family pyridoxal phosphate-dependent enzyme [Armatimonadota bacterium]